MLVVAQVLLLIGITSHQTNCQLINAVVVGDGKYSLNNKLKCVDEDPDECPYKKELCKDSALVQMQCKKTCGICIEDCRDRSADCNKKKKIGSCDSLLMKRRCKKTCGLCRTDCRDRSDDCNKKKTIGSCDSLLMKRRCKKTCGLCRTDESPVTVGDQLADLKEKDPLVLWKDTSNNTAEERSAYKFIQRVDVESSQWCNEKTNAKWGLYTNVTDENENKYESVVEKANDWIRNTIVTHNAEWNWQSFRDPDLKRHFHLRSVLGNHGLLSDSRAKLANLRIEILNNRKPGKICVYNPVPQDENTKKKCNLIFKDVSNIMSESNNYDELAYYWMNYRANMRRQMKIKYNSIIGLYNEAAKHNGFDHAEHMWLTIEYGDINLTHEIDKLWKAISPLYKEIHAYVRSRLRKIHGTSKIGHRSPIPAHLLGDMWAKHWDKKFRLFAPFPEKLPLPTDVTKEIVAKGYEGKELVKMSEDLFISLNFSKMPEDFWKNSIFEKFQDGNVKCSEMSWDFCNHEDYRMITCPPFNVDQMLSIHSAFTRLQYYRQYSHLPNTYRRPANPAFEWAVGKAILLSIDSPNYLQKVGLIKDIDPDYEMDMNILMKRALETIAPMPFVLATYKWRLDVFSNETKIDDWNCNWWYYRLTAQGVAPPVMRTEDNFDPGTLSEIVEPKSIIKNFIGIILEYQFHRALCIKAQKYNVEDGINLPLHKCDISESKEAGEALKNMMSLGRSQEWDKTLKALTGFEFLDPTALREYFKPLEDWLRKENIKNEEQIGWDLDVTYCHEHGANPILDHDHEHIHFHLYSDSGDDFTSHDDMANTTEKEIKQVLDKLLKWK